MVTTARETKIKPGYKQTEVGVIPEDWMITKLGEVADVKTGPFGSTLHEKDYVDDGTPIITVEHLGEYGVAHEGLPMVSESDRKRLGAYSLLPGDIVFSRVGSVDRNSLIKEEERGWLFSGRLLRIRIKTSNVFAPFLSYYFHHESTKQRIRTVAVGQTMASLNTQILRNIDTAFPSITSEQIAIATALNDVDALLTSLDKLIAKKRDIKQATMQQLLTGKMRLSGLNIEPQQTYRRTEAGLVPTDWEIKKLEEIVEFLDGRRKPIRESDRAKLHGEYPYYGASGIVDYVNDYIFNEELILLGEDGENILSRNCRLAFQVSGKIWVNNHAHVLRPKAGINIKFLTEYLESLDYKQYNTGTAQPKLNKKVCSEIIIPLPSLPEQQAIATVLSDMDAEIEALEQRREKTRALKQGMMQELLTGKTRLL